MVDTKSFLQRIGVLKKPRPSFRPSRKGDVLQIKDLTKERERLIFSIEKREQQSIPSLRQARFRELRERATKRLTTEEIKIQAQQAEAEQITQRELTGTPEQITEKALRGERGFVGGQSTPEGARVFFNVGEFAPELKEAGQTALQRLTPSQRARATFQEVGVGFTKGVVNVTEATSEFILGAGTRAGTPEQLREGVQIKFFEGERFQRLREREIGTLGKSVEIGTEIAPIGIGVFQLGKIAKREGLRASFGELARAISPVQIKETIFVQPLAREKFVGLAERRAITDEISFRGVAAIQPKTQIKVSEFSLQLDQPELTRAATARVTEIPALRVRGGVIEEGKIFTVGGGRQFIQTKEIPSPIEPFAVKGEPQTFVGTAEERLFSARFVSRQGLEQLKIPKEITEGEFRALSFEREAGFRRIIGGRVRERTDIFELPTIPSTRASEIRQVRKVARPEVDILEFTKDLRGQFRDFSLPTPKEKPTGITFDFRRELKGFDATQVQVSKQQRAISTISRQSVQRDINLVTKSLRQQAKQRELELPKISLGAFAGKGLYERTTEVSAFQIPRSQGVQLQTPRLDVGFRPSQAIGQIQIPTQREIQSALTGQTQIQIPRQEQTTTKILGTTFAPPKIPITPIPPFIPSLFPPFKPPFFPPVLPSLDFDEFPRKRKKGKRKFRRTPSLISLELGIEAPRPIESEISGLVVRPILTTRRSRKGKR